MKLWDRIKQHGDDASVVSLLRYSRVKLWRWYQAEVDANEGLAAEARKAHYEAHGYRCQLAALRRDTDAELAELRDRAVIDAGQIELLQEAANQQRARLPQPDWSKVDDLMTVVRPGDRLEAAYRDAGPQLVAAGDQQLMAWRDSLRAWGLDPEEPSHLWAVIATAELLERWAAMGGLACGAVLTMVSTTKVMSAQLVEATGVVRS